MRIIVVDVFARWRQLRDEKDMKTEEFSPQKLTLESFLKKFLRKTSTKTQGNSNVSPVLCNQHLLSVLRIFPLIKSTKCEIKFNNIKALLTFHQSLESNNILAWLAVMLLK